MQRENVVELAGLLASKRYLCSESILIAISNWLGIQNELIPKIATGFGAGIGGCGTVCGAISGGVIALGLIFGRNEVKETTVRPYWFARELLEKFEKEFGHVTCRELTGCILGTDEGRKKFVEEKMWDTKCRHYIQGVTAMVYDMISERSLKS
jgi:C_GCAxxG_C_C family probable redox protein